MREFDAAARHVTSAAGFKALWGRVFGATAAPLSDRAAKSFEHYYKEMRSKKSHARRHKTRRQRGGVAPVGYGMGPGIFTNSHGHFPVEVDTDPGSLKALDTTIWNDSLLLSKPATWWPQVPADMGSNKVGGRRRRGRRAGTRRGPARRQRGGDLMESLFMRPLPYTTTPYPNIVQSVSNSLAGGTSPVPTPSSPVQYTWLPSGTPGAPINPGQITPIANNFDRLASPAPWQTTQ